MDAYRNKNLIVLWLKTNEQDLRVEFDFSSLIYADLEVEDFLNKNKISYKQVTKKTYLKTKQQVLEIKVLPSEFERLRTKIEQGTRYKIPLYNADILPEQMFLYKNNIVPFQKVLFDNASKQLFGLEGDDYPDLTVLQCDFVFKRKLKSFVFNGKEYSGDEFFLLNKFKSLFNCLNPDVIISKYAFSRIPQILGLFKKHNIDFSFNRWDDYEIKYKGGRSYWSYGQVRYQDFAVRLRGRFLLDDSSFVGSECDVLGIAELSFLSGTLFQHLASRSFGAVFQTALIREMVIRDVLIPYKEKPIDGPLSMLEMLKADRGGYIHDAEPGFHRNVAEIDFTSMFPWLIYNHNISADSMLCDIGPFEKIPDVPAKTTRAFKGLIPYVLKPFIDRRMYYKKNPTKINKQRAAGLKWVLVSCYGYLRFREFKLGIPTSHMAICALARETLVKVMRLAEKKGFTVVHGIVDALYVKKANLTEKEVLDLCKEIELMTGIPVSFDGIFSWIVFLKSSIDEDRILPSTYYGVFKHGDIKVRGIELRKRNSPKFVKDFQRELIFSIKDCKSKKQVRESFPKLCKVLHQYVDNLRFCNIQDLLITLKISKLNYKNNIPQKIILEQLLKRGVDVRPGQVIHFVQSNKGLVLPDDFKKPNLNHYEELLVRAFLRILSIFGMNSNILANSKTKQTTLLDFGPMPTVYYFTMNKEYSQKKGLSERLARRKLEKAGWLVWRGAMIGIFRKDKELYPNVAKKYALLYKLLKKDHSEIISLLEYTNKVNHGMPDFLCYKNGLFKFVECKLQYEQLSNVQKKCIRKLLNLGFKVEVHTLVDNRTKATKAVIKNGKKKVLEKQLVIR